MLLEDESVEEVRLRRRQEQEKEGAGEGSCETKEEADRYERMRKEPWNSQSVTSDSLFTPMVLSLQGSGP